MNVLKSLLTSLFFFLYFISIGNSQELEPMLDKKIPEFMKSKHVPGMAIAIIENGKIVINKGYGFSDVNKQKLVTSTTGFNIGSISKLYTAWGVMKLVEERKIYLDDPVEKYLTRWKLPKSKYDHKKVTIRALLSHTAGISVHGYAGFPSNKNLPTIEKSLDGVNGPVRADKRVEIIIEPQTKFQYSGGGYTLLQLLIEEVTGKKFADYMRVKIFKPLKMKKTSFQIDRKILKNSAIPYDEKGQESHFEFFRAQAAAGLHTTLNDFILFAENMLTNSKILSRETLQEMIKPVMSNYGLGYRTLKMGPFNLKGHTGSNTGWQSAFFVDFQRKSAIIMMTNGDDGKRVLQNTLRTWLRWKNNQKK